MMNHGLIAPNDSSSPADVASAVATAGRTRLHTEPKIEPLSFHQPRWVGGLLLLGDIAALELALFLGWLVRESLTPWLGGALRKGQYEALALGMLALPLAYLFVGLYPGYGMNMVERLRRRVYTVTVLFGLLILWDYFVVKGHTSRGVLLSVYAFALTLGPVVEAAIRFTLMRLGAWGQPVVVLGAGKIGRLLVQVLKREPELGYVPIAVFDDDPAKWDTQIEGVPVFGPIARCRVMSDRATVAFMAMPRLAGDRQASMCCRLQFPRVILIPDLEGLSSLWVRSRDLGGVVGLEVQKNLSLRRNWYLKRTMDYVLGVPLFLMSLPILAAFAIWIRWESPGASALYRQPRVGFGGRTIQVWKLRTMYPDAEARLQDHLAADEQAAEQWERYHKLRNDPRVLPRVGRLLRRTSLDELPQLWNVLRGEMSLVGPRPFPHYHLDSFDASFRTLRRRVVPGLTGLWQVAARSEGDIEVQEVLDTYYIRNWSIWLDLYLLVRTISAVLVGRGAY